LSADTAARRNDVEYCGGFTIQELQDYINKRYVEEKGQTVSISNSSVRHLFIEPNKAHRSSQLYKNLFNIKQLGGTDLFSLAIPEKNTR